MNEFRKAAKDFRFGLSEQEVEKAFLAFDRDNTGIIDYDEFFFTEHEQDTRSDDHIKRIFGVLQ